MSGIAQPGHVDSGSDLMSAQDRAGPFLQIPSSDNLVNNPVMAFQILNHEESSSVSIFLMY